VSFFAAGGGLAVVAGLGLRYIESRCEMDDTQGAAPGNTEPATDGGANLPVGECTAPIAGASAVGLSLENSGSASLAGTKDTGSTTPASDFVTEVDSGNVGAGTAPDGAATPAIVDLSVSPQSDEVVQMGEPSAAPESGTGSDSSKDVDPNAAAETAANPSSQPSADSDASTSGGDTGEQPAEEPEDSGTPSQSNSTAAPAQDVEFVESPGNAAGPVDSAATATSPEDALTAVVAVTAAAFSVDMMDRFEARTYPDGTTMKTVGALPEASPVSYPAPTAPAVDTPHGLLNAIEAYFTSALRSSRTDGHKLIAQLRATLPQD
jgi:hypothetical protein